MLTREEIRKRIRVAMEGAPDDRRAVTERLKSFINAERASVFEAHARDEKGAKVCRALCQVADGVVEFIFEHACRANADRPASRAAMSLLALGGYGRGLLNPFSDVDMLILYDEGHRAEDDARIATITRLLWDIGFHVGQSCRTVEDCKRAMRDSIQTASAFFDARLITGDEGLFQAMRRQALAPFLARQKKEFVAACLESTRERHKGFHDSPFGIEPNVKESPGGLRDAQVVSWLQRILGDSPLRNYHFVSAEWPEAVREAHDFLLRVRTAMHIHAERANDLLDLRTQRIVAETLGYKEQGGFSPPELFMRDYYRSAAAIYRELRLEMQRAEHTALSGVLDLRGRWRRWLGDGLVSTAGKLYIADRNFLVGPDVPRRLMNLFLVSQSTRREVSQAALREIRARLSVVDDAFRTDRKAARLFLDIFGGQGNVASTLRAMRDCGLLEEYLPEFGALSCLVWYRNYHDYTVDEHTLNAIAVLDELRSSGREEDAFKRKILLEIERPNLLFLAVLLHDIGKSVSGDHAENGATMAPTIAERLGLSEDETKRLYFLVAEHLRMIHTAQSRDLREESVVEEFAAKVGSLADLKALYLLTYADTKAVGRGAWTQWQDTLLQELYERAAIILSKGEAGVVARHGLLDRMRPLLSTPGLLKAAEEHCALVPERYLIEVEPADAVEHLRFVEELRRRPVVISVREERNVTRLWISTTDRPARFSQIAGTLSGSGVDIVSAQAYTRRDGIIFDRFQVVDVHGKVVTDREFWEKVEANLVNVLEGRVPVQELIARQQRRVAFKRVIPQMGATRIVIENKSSPRYTVIDVGTWDRIGLLYAISSAISALELDIHFAKIATKANRATDVFYVTDKNTGQKITCPHRQRAIARKLYETCETFGA